MMGLFNLLIIDTKHIRMNTGANPLYFGYTEGVIMKFYIGTAQFGGGKTD